MSTDPTRIDINVDPRERRMRGTAIHGNTPFDVPFLSHIEDNLFTGGCTDGLILPDVIQHVVSLYPWEEYRVYHELRSMTSVRLYDAEPEGAITQGLAKWAAACVDDAPTLIHCQAGLNRSGLLAALVLMERGRSADEAIALLREKRSPAVLCNPMFEQFLRDAA